jgi:predicted transcriptional regulator
MMRHTIMTEKIIRRGVRVPSDYTADYLDQIAVGAICSRNVVSLHSAQPVSEVRAWLDEGSIQAQHQGFPVLKDGIVIGVVTRKNLLKPNIPADACIEDLVQRPPLVVQESHSAREAADHMVENDVGRMVVVADKDPTKMIGIVTRGDLLAAHTQRIKEARKVERHLSTPFYPKKERDDL